MSKRKRFGVSEALTRGLTETIHVVENNAGIFRNVVLPLSRIELDPENPRKLAISIEDVQMGIKRDDPLYTRKMEELERLKDLASTIESSGIINPIVVYKRGEVYRVVAGERRCLASMIAHKNEIDARVFNEKPKGFELKLLQWIENTAREDLTLAERIDNIREIFVEYEKQHGEVNFTATLLKNLSGLSLPQATYYLSVMNAPSDIQAAILSGELRSLDKAAVIAGVSDPMIRKQALDACISGSSLKEIRKVISTEKMALRQQQLAVQPKRGRTTSRVSMGFTLNTGVVQTIAKSVLEQPQYRKYVDMFSRVHWDNYDHSTRAFKKLIEILEQEVQIKR